MSFILPKQIMEVSNFPISLPHLAEGGLPGFHCQCTPVGEGQAANMCHTETKTEDERAKSQDTYTR